MKIQLKNYKNGYLGISDEEVNKTGVYVFEHNLICQVNTPNTKYQNSSKGFKILFTTPNLKLEGVPLIDLNVENRFIKVISKPKVPVSVDVEIETFLSAHAAKTQTNWVNKEDVIQNIKTQTINGDEYVIVKKVNYEIR